MFWSFARISQRAKIYADEMIVRAKLVGSGGKGIRQMEYVRGTSGRHKCVYRALFMFYCRHLECNVSRSQKLGWRGRTSLNMGTCLRLRRPQLRYQSFVCVNLPGCRAEHRAVSVSNRIFGLTANQPTLGSTPKLAIRSMPPHEHPPTHYLNLSATLENWK